jgi:hypothetical protein
MTRDTVKKLQSTDRLSWATVVPYGCSAEFKKALSAVATVATDHPAQCRHFLMALQGEIEVRLKLLGGGK